MRALRKGQAGILGGLCRGFPGVALMDIRHLHNARSKKAFFNKLLLAS